jgi:hypothetical protein
LSCFEECAKVSSWVSKKTIYVVVGAERRIERQSEGVAVPVLTGGEFEKLEIGIKKDLISGVTLSLTA